MKTSNSGYLQRKMVKIMENLMVKQDNSVRNATNNIVQFVYGDTMACGTKTMLKGGKPMVCDIGRLVDKLNRAYEQL